MFPEVLNEPLSVASTTLLAVQGGVVRGIQMDPHGYAVIIKIENRVDTEPLTALEDRESVY